MMISCPMCDNLLELIKTKRGYIYRCESYPNCFIERKAYKDEIKEPHKDATWEKFNFNLNEKQKKQLFKKHEKWAA